MTEPASPAGWTAGTVTPLAEHLGELARLRLDLRHAQKRQLDAQDMRDWYKDRAEAAEKKLDALVMRIVRLRKLVRGRWLVAMACWGFIPGFTLGYGWTDLMEWLR